jgi:hypothetical protein
LTVREIFDHDIQRLHQVANLEGDKTETT